MPSEVIHFGDFELDPGAFELRRSGRVVRLERIPLELLLFLAEQRGQLVTRDEILERIWGKDVFVDADNSINTAVRKVRSALKEDPDNPRFLRTVPGKGYRFVAEVSSITPRARIASASALEVAPVGSVATTTGNVRRWAVQPALATASAPIEIPANPESKMRGPVDQQVTLRTKSLLKRGYVVAAVALLLSICVVAIWRSQPRIPAVTNVVRITSDRKPKIPMNLPVTDGVHLYFVEGAPWTSGSGIAQMSATGGETTWITTTLQKVLAIYSISPDHSALLVANGVAVGADVATGRSDSAAELWVQPLPAGAPHRVGNVYASAACWTPDGLHIVYGDGPAIMIANNDGSEPHQVAKVSGIVRLLRFSPDGRRIRFSVIHSKAESNSIWEMSSNGEEIHLLFPEWKERPYQSSGNWSPDGDYYYFQAGRGSAQAIWVKPEHRSIFRRAAVGPFNLTSGPLRFSAPVPSSDGKKLFVVGEEPRVELFRYDPRTQRFDSYLEGLSAGPVDFSSDKKWVAYIAYPEMTLWRSRVDGSDKMQLTFPPVRAYEPRWSPDGSQITFMDVQFNRPWKIRLLSSSGGVPELLLQASPDQTESDPTWTPDGKSIVFGKTGETEKSKIAIYRLDLNIKEVFPVPDSDGLFSPRVSPDGRYICALSEGQTKLMLFDTNTNQWSILAEGEGVSYNEWSHDGKYVYIRKIQGGAAELVRVRIRDRVLEHVLSLKNFPHLVDMFAAWTGLTPDDEPLLMRDRSVQEIYALDLRFH